MSVGQDQKEMFTGNLFNNPRFQSVALSDKEADFYKKVGEQMYAFDYVNLGKKKKQFGFGYL